ncbi:hypothetical protein VTO42DRAFT_8744 [Malbranchea cinnamomea]
MAASRLRFSWLSTLFTVVTVLSLSVPSQALYFYVSGRQRKCFYEELPQDTLVVGTYKAEVYNPRADSYGPNSGLMMVITVEETFDNDHRVLSQRGGDSGRFTFTAADAGEHKLCFSPDSQGSGGWLSGASGPVKLTVDLAIGETSKIESEDKGKLEDMASRVRNLNSRLQDIRREQVFQREREAQFRDQSELTNARVVRWTVIQIIVLLATCAWQLSHLRSFFIKQKLT